MVTTEPTIPLTSEPRVSSVRLCAAMFLVSFATVLFTLSIWKLLSFFIMPSLFFDLLFVGFPIGAFLGVRFFRVSLRSFQASLVILQVVMALSVAASLACKHFDYLRAHLFDVHIGKLLLQMGTFTIIFLPFFCAYGLSEYIGYQLGTRQFHGRMRWIYGVYLLGAGFAYICLNTLLGWAGVTGLLGAAIGLVPLAALLIARSAAGRAVLFLEATAVLSLIFFPSLQLERRFLEMYKGHGIQSTWWYRDTPELAYRPAFQKWGRYSLTEILYGERQHKFAGFYNDVMQWEYARGTGFDERMLGAIPLEIAPRRGRIAIIGAGGGRQVQWALQPRFDFQEVFALELEPAVIDAVRGPLRHEFDDVYERATVVPIVSEARTYMENHPDARFDLIFLPSVGGYPQMMLEPGNMIRTFDAYRTLRDRLTEHGLLAIWYPAGLDMHGILTNQYVRTLGTHARGLGMKTRAYYNYGEYLILATRDPATPLPVPEDIERFLKSPDGACGLPPRKGPTAQVRSYIVPEDPHFKPITDEQPFLAGNVRHIFSLEQLYTLFAMVGGFLLLTGLLLARLLRRAGNPQIPGRSYRQVAAMACVIGANFILCEHLVVLALFRKLYVFQDALLLGAISFLVVSGLGSLLITPRLRGISRVLAAAVLLPVLLWPARLSPEMIIVLTAPMAFVTGSFFPALFELSLRNPLGVFAMDAAGAALGSATAFFIPIAFGFSVFFPVAAAVFLFTAIVTWRFCRGLQAPA